MRNSNLKNAKTRKKDDSMPKESYTVHEHENVNSKEKIKYIHVKGKLCIMPRSLKLKPGDVVVIERSRVAVSSMEAAVSECDTGLRKSVFMASGGSEIGDEIMEGFNDA